MVWSPSWHHRWKQMTDPLFLRFPPPQLETKESFFSNRAFVRVCVCVCALCFWWATICTLCNSHSSEMLDHIMQPQLSQWVSLQILSTERLLHTGGDERKNAEHRTQNTERRTQKTERITQPVATGSGFERCLCLSLSACRRRGGQTLWLGLCAVAPMGVFRIRGGHRHFD